jgi:hypothetical protein
MTAITETPSTAVDSTPTSAWRCSARNPSDTTGRTSLNDMLATKVMNADVAISNGGNPQDVYMAYETPTAIAPPPGSVMATLVEDWHTTAACASVSPGMAATSIGQ